MVRLQGSQQALQGPVGQSEVTVGQLGSDCAAVHSGREFHARLVECDAEAPVANNHGEGVVREAGHPTAGDAQEVSAATPAVRSMCDFLFWGVAVGMRIVVLSVMGSTLF